MAARMPIVRDLAADIDSIVSAEGRSYGVGEYIEVLEKLAERHQDVDLADARIAIVQFCYDKGWNEFSKRWEPGDDPVVVDGILHICGNFSNEECRVFDDDGVLTALLNQLRPTGCSGVLRPGHGGRPRARGRAAPDDA